MAGETVVWSGDQPRGRGEQTYTIATETKTLGPTPRARGAVGCGAGCPVRHGTNPAGAGSRLGDLQ